LVWAVGGRYCSQIGLDSAIHRGIAGVFLPAEDHLSCGSSVHAVPLLPTEIARIHLGLGDAQDYATALVLLVPGNANGIVDVL